MNLQDLRKSPLFQGLSDEELQKLMDMAEPVSLRAGDTLIKQGEPGDAAYVVISGDFEVQKQSGQSLIKIDVRNPGDVVGEMALLSRAPRNATLIAKTDGEVLRIPQEAFRKTKQPGWMILYRQCRDVLKRRSNSMRWKRSIWWTSFSPGWKRAESNPPGTLRPRWSTLAGMVNRLRS
jgi:CRP-like cAMP-binding protein